MYVRDGGVLLVITYEISVSLVNNSNICNMFEIFSTPFLIIAEFNLTCVNTIMWISNYYNFRAFLNFSMPSIVTN